MCVNKKKILFNSSTASFFVGTVRKMRLLAQKIGFANNCCAGNWSFFWCPLMPNFH